MDQRLGGRHADRSAETLPGKLSESLTALWTRYAGTAPGAVRTGVHGNVVTCVLVDAVNDFNLNTVAPQTEGTSRGVGKFYGADYKLDAVAAVTGLTRQRVSSFISSHDAETDVATEIFTLEPSLSRGAPRLARMSANSARLPPPRP
jgi:hypothetical protein